MRRCVLITAACAAVVFAAAVDGAAASTVTVTSAGRLDYTASPGETNQLTISPGASLAISDPGANIVVVGPACTGGGVSATCSAATRITVSGGDGDDTLTNDTALPSTMAGDDGNDTLRGGAGNDSLRGGPGFDQIFAGAGDDVVDTRGNVADFVDCGDGTDTVLADQIDRAAINCESVQRPGQPVPG